MLSDFGTAQHVPPGAHNGGRWMLPVHPFHPPDGNTAHRAPEVLAAVRRVTKKNANKTYPVAVEKQSAFACGVLLYEIALNAHPFDDYPNSGPCALQRRTDDLVITQQLRPFAVFEVSCAPCAPTHRVRCVVRSAATLHCSDNCSTFAVFEEHRVVPPRSPPLRTFAWDREDGNGAGRGRRGWSDYC